MNKEIAKIFREMADLLNVRGDSSFHINAYRKAAEYLDSLPRDVGDIYKENGIWSAWKTPGKISNV